MAHIRNHANDRLHRVYGVAGGDREFRKQAVRFRLGLLALVPQILERGRHRLRGVFRTLILAEKDKIQLVVGHGRPYGIAATSASTCIQVKIWRMSGRGTERSSAGVQPKVR